MPEIFVITAGEVSDKVRELSLSANIYLPEDVKSSLAAAREAEMMPQARSVCGEIIKNAELAAEKHMPICQDCGMAVIFAELG